MRSILGMKKSMGMVGCCLSCAGGIGRRGIAVSYGQPFARCRVEEGTLKVLPVSRGAARSWSSDNLVDGKLWRLKRRGTPGNRYLSGRILSHRLALGGRDGAVTCCELAYHCTRYHFEASGGRATLIQFLTAI